MQPAVTAPHQDDESSTTPTSEAFAMRSDSDAPPRNGQHRASTPPLLKAPLGQTFGAHVRMWGDAEIASFLSMYKCDQYIELFNRNDIDGKVLLDLDMSSLKEIGISKIGDRVKLLGGVRDLRKRAARTPSSAMLGARILPTLVPAVDGSPVPASDARSSQVQKRLATALFSKRLASSRPPPLNLQRPNPLSSAMEGSTSGGSPNSRSITPKSGPPKAGPPKAVSALTEAGTSRPPLPSQDPSVSLRPPVARETRRSPSPVTAQTLTNPNMRIGMVSGESSSQMEDPWSSVGPSIKNSDRRQGVHRYDTRTDYMNGKSVSPTQPHVRDNAPPHPFASVLRKDDAGLSESHKRIAPPRNGNSSSLPGEGNPHRTIPLEDLWRHLVKFVNSEDGTTRTVNVSNCTSGLAVLDLVLKKFGKGGSNWNPDSDSGDSDRLEWDGWGVFTRKENGEEDQQLSESSLLDICHDQRSVRLGALDPTVVRERGLLIKRVSQQPNRKNMEIFFGEAPPPPGSPNSPSHYGVPRLGRQAEDRRDSATKPAANKQMNRASTVSIMSGLGVPGAVDTSPSVNTSRTSSSGNVSSRTKRMYNFFGHRPPSELISNHLSEYFPSARKRDLEKTVRQSMRLSQAPTDRLALGGALGTASPLSASLENVASPNRKARPPSTRTVSSSTTPAVIPEEVETAPHDGAVRSTSSVDHDENGTPVDSHPPLLPPFESTGESLVDSLQEYSPAPASVRPALRPGRRGSTGSTLSRISVISSVRRNKDKSDTASLLTVDEITAEVENRRASMATADMFDTDPSLASASSSVISIPDSDDESSDTEDSEDEEEDSATSDDDDRDQGRALTSTGSRRMIKWIKGALIGQGSFGSVFLGMDAQSGLLMAVKQVELPSGDVRNEEKKRNMVQALEREIELLKELQHENIVQYLDSATDGNHLYIFLEYVPGGSVAALLNNYGAFEEALVRNFVRQILTGLNYLHERGIIHRDIKGANILVDNKGGIKISDFGISKKAENKFMAGIAMRANRPSLQGSVFWMAPEVVKQTIYTSKADIWSVGCLVVEMLTGTHPWAELDQMQAFFRIGSMARPSTPSDISADAAEFLQRTLEIDHDLRPTASALLEHTFITAQASAIPGAVSIEQANAAMDAVAAARRNPMPGLPPVV